MDKPKKDCEVCERLIKEKHRYDFVWKIACIIFLALAVIFAILYFSSGAMITETTIELNDNSYIGNDVESSGDGSIDVGGDVIVDGKKGDYSGTATSVDTTPIIAISIIAGAAIIMAGVIIVANNNKKDR